MKMKKKRQARKNVIHGRKPFLTPILRASENDLGNDYGYNEDIICLVSRLIKWFIKRGHTNGHH